MLFPPPQHCSQFFPLSFSLIHIHGHHCQACICTVYHNTKQWIYSMYLRIYLGWNISINLHKYYKYVIIQNISRNKYVRNMYVFYFNCDTGDHTNRMFCEEYVHRYIYTNNVQTMKIWVCVVLTGQCASCMQAVLYCHHQWKLYKSGVTVSV